MDGEDRVIVLHEDGRTYSVPREAAATLYGDFAIVGDESEESFEPVGIPIPRPPRRKVRKKAAKEIADEPEAPAPPEPVTVVDGTAAEPA